MTAPTPGPWTVLRGTRTNYKGEKYGLEIAAHVPIASQRPWESAGYIPIAEVFHPANPIRTKDYENAAMMAEIRATQETNARLLAAAFDLYTHSRRFFAAHDGTTGLTPEEVAAWREVVRNIERG